MNQPIINGFQAAVSETRPTNGIGRSVKCPLGSLLNSRPVIFALLSVVHVPQCDRIGKWHSLYMNILTGTSTHQCLSYSNRLYILQIISHAKCGAVCVQFTHSSYDHCRNMCSLYHYYHHQIESMIYLPLFRVRPRNNGMRRLSHNHKWGHYGCE